MRYLVGFMCVLALGVMGCSKTSGDGAQGGTGGGGALVTVTGTVYAAVAEDIQGPTVANATVSVVGSNSTTTDPDGNFSLMVPTGTQLFLSEAADSWGELFAEDVPAGGAVGLELEVIPDDLLGDLAGDVGVVPDASKGIVAVVFDETVRRQNISDNRARLLRDGSWFWPRPRWRPGTPFCDVASSAV